MTQQIRGFTFGILTLAAVSLAACGGGGGSPAPATPPSPILNDSTPPVTTGQLTSTYDGRTFTYASQDGSCQGSILLSVNDPNFTVIADNSSCWDLFKTTFTLVCHEDGLCIGRDGDHLANISAQLVDANTITFTVTNDVENVPHTMTYTAQPVDNGGSDSGTGTGT